MTQVAATPDQARKRGRPTVLGDRPLTRAEKQRRYRERLEDVSIAVDREAHDRQTFAVAELLEAIDQAAARGVPLALAAGGGINKRTAPIERIMRLAAAIRRMKGHPNSATNH